MNRGNLSCVLALAFALVGCAGSGPVDPMERAAVSAIASESENDLMVLAAERGDADSQFRLANDIERGHGRPQSYAKAFEWYARAAEQGHAAAQFYLGAMYASSRAPKGQDLAEAVRLYRLSASQGYVDAMFPVAYAFEYGISVERDSRSALDWYRRSAELGVWQAMERLATAYEQGELGLASDPSLAEEWRSKAKGARPGHVPFGVRIRP